MKQERVIAILDFYRDIDKTVTMNERVIRNLEDQYYSTLGAVNSDGMPHGKGGVSNHVERVVLNIPQSVSDTIANMRRENERLTAIKGEILSELNALNYREKAVIYGFYICDNILEPAFSKAFIRDNYASQSGRGTHDGLYRLEEFMRSYYFTRKAKAERERRAAGLPPPGPEEVRRYSDGWVLKCDISKYFYSIQHEPLKQMTRKYIKDPDILWLVDLIVDSTENPGIPIGNQTSQWFAVMYLSGMDHFIKEKLGIRYYGRYMDDFYLIHEDKAYLQYCRGEIERYVARLGLRLNKKTNIFPLRNGIDFLGFHTYLTESGKIIRKVRRSSKSNAQRKLKKQRGLLDREKISLSDIEQSYGSWRSHAVKGNCYHLIQKTDSLFQNLFKESEKQWPKV